MSTPPSSDVKRAQQELGARLRDIRKAAGLSGRHLAAQTKQHYTRLSKIENGVQAPTDVDIRQWCQVCGTVDQIPDLIATLRTVESAYLEFRRQARAGMKRVLGPHTQERYERTQVFRIYEHNAIPGLFQTVDYSASMLSFWIHFLDTVNDLDDAVAVRMRRQAVVRRGGKRFVVVLEEQALRTWFGTAETQAGQLRRLLEVMAYQNVSVGIIPLMAKRAAVGSTGFWIFDNELAALETPTVSIEITRPDELDLYARMFEVLKLSAVYGPAARALITATLDELT